MAEPIIFKKLPTTMYLSPGDYLWCACGRSKTQPLCDGSHESTDFAPVPFTVTEKKKIVLCNCKHSLTPPFCDGSHIGLA
ncbi:MAG TPA: CDGSH iron-sulfur domain-containing protein [Planctomycetota bacterium]|nr:CDGSH iron-sulfur domain-containing protein [Planctomycetota bacterium]